MTDTKVKDKAKENGNNTLAKRSEELVAQNYAGRADVRELADRITVGLPGMQGVPDHAVIGFAQYALAHDLDPWNGEIWLCVQRDKSTGSIKDMWVQAGVKGLRKGAKRELPRGHFMDPRFTKIRSDEMEEYGLSAKDVLLAYKCSLRRTDATERYIEQLDKLFKITGSYKEARELLGDPPIYEGIGVVMRGDYSKMEKNQLAMKRAETDAIKRAFDLPFGGDRNDDVETAGLRGGDDAIEGDFAELEAPPSSSSATPDTAVEEPREEPEETPEPSAEETPDTPAEAQNDAPETPDAPDADEDTDTQPNAPENAEPPKDDPNFGNVKGAVDSAKAEALIKRGPPKILSYQDAAKDLNGAFGPVWDEKNPYKQMARELRKMDGATERWPEGTSIKLEEAWADLVRLSARM